MEKPQIKAPKGKRYVISIPLGFVIFLVLVRLLIYLPPVQSWLVLQAKGFLEPRLGTTINIESVDVSFPDKAELIGLQVLGQGQDTLLNAQRLETGLFQFSLWKILFSRDEVQNVVLDNVKLEGADIQLYRSQLEKKFNFQFLIDSLKPKGEGSLKLRMELANIEIENSRVLFRDSSHVGFDSLVVGRLNYWNLDLDQINGRMGLLLQPDGSIHLNVHQLALQERNSGFPVDELISNLHIVTEDTLAGRNASIYTNRFTIHSQDTHLKGKIEFPGAELRTILDANFDEDFLAQLEPSTLDFNTLNYFAPRELPIHGLWGVRGYARGNLERLKLEGVKVGFGDSTLVDVTGWLYNITKTDIASYKLHLPQGSLAIGELREILKGFTLPETLQQVRRLGIQGDVDGTYSSVNYLGSLNSNVGNLEMDFQMQFPPAVEVFSYVGEVSSQSLNLNAILAGPNISKDLNFSGSINGQGTTLADMKTEIDAYILNSDFLGYKVDSLYARVYAEDHILKGYMYGLDGEGLASVNVDLDLQHSPATYSVNGNVEELNLKKYGIYDQEILLTTGLVLDMVGDSLEEMNGKLKMVSSKLSRKNDTLAIRVPDLWFETFNDSKGKYLNLKSALFDADLAGDFTLKRISTFSQMLLKEIQLFLTNDDSLTQDYYAQKPEDETEVQVLFGIAARDSLNQIFQFLDEPYYISPGTLLRGELSFGTAERLSILLENADSLQYQDIRLTKAFTSIDLYKTSMQNRFAFTGEVRMDTMKIGPKFDIHNFAVDLQGLNRNFETDVIAMQGEDNNRIQLKLKSEFFNSGKITTTIDSTYSHLVFRKDSLYIGDGDSLIIADGAYDIRDLLIQDETRYIRLDGLIADSSEYPLRLSLSGLGLNLLTDLYPLYYQPDGLVNAEIEMLNLLSDPELSVVSRIDSFALDEFPYGDVYVKSSWKQSLGNLALHASLLGETDTTLTLDGNYDMSDEKSPLDFDIITQKGFPLNLPILL